jgi:hypothetical protein
MGQAPWASRATRTLFVVATACAPPPSFVEQGDGAALLPDAGRPDGGRSGCTPGQDWTCAEGFPLGENTGHCELDRTCSCFGGATLNPQSGRCRASPPDAGVPRPCTPGADQTCNDDVFVSSFQGACQPDGTCVCLGDNVLNPETGRCRFPDRSCLPLGSCMPAEPDGACPTGRYNAAPGACGPGPDTLCCALRGDVGSPCDDDNPCAVGGCLPEPSGYPTGGLCTHACTPGEGPCPDWAVCLPVFFSQAPGVCLVPCAGDGECREGWSCQAFPASPFTSGGQATYACWGPGTNAPLLLGAPCQENAACLSGRCRAGLCAAPCDDRHPCLPGATCVVPPECSGPDCGLCM